MTNPPDLSRTDILIVDDEAFVRSTLKQMLRHFGNPSVRESADGDNALAMILHKRPDVILCDLNMQPKNGFDLVAEIRANDNLRFLPIIMLTASAEQGDVTRAKSLRISSYLIKPVSVKILGDRLSAALER